MRKLLLALFVIGALSACNNPFEGAKHGQVCIQKSLVGDPWFSDEWKCTQYIVLP